MACSHEKPLCYTNQLLVSIQAKVPWTGRNTDGNE